MGGIGVPVNFPPAIEVEILVSDCAVQSDLGREVMRQSIAQAAEAGEVSNRPVSRHSFVQEKLHWSAL